MRTKYKNCSWLKEAKNSEYTKAVEGVLQALKVSITINYHRTDPAPWDETNLRNEYLVTVSRGKHRFSYSFWDSIHSTESNERPTAYDVLCCLDHFTRGSFEEFAGDMGWSTDSIKALEAWKETSRIDKHLSRMFSESEREKLNEVCQ